MAGYVPQGTVYKLRFADPEMGGLVVRARGLSVGELISVGRMKAEAEADDGAESLDKVLRVFASKLVDWNVETCPYGECPEDCAVTHDPVPANFEGLTTQEPAFTLALLDAWMTAVAGVSLPLGRSLPGGSPSGLESLPMETLPASQAS
jgi:hypothetical protein